MNRPAWRACVAACVVVILALSCAASRDVESYFDLARQGTERFRAGDYGGAISRLRTVARRFPDNPELLYAIGCAHACLGHPDRAIEQLERAVEAGLDDADMARAEPCLEKLRSERRFLELTTAMEANADRWKKRMATVHAVVDPAEAPVYESLEALERDFHGQGTHEVMLRGAKAYRLWRWSIADRKIAALRRYVGDHPTAPDRENAAFRVVDYAARYKADTLLERWEGDAGLAVEMADRYLASFPDGEHRARVELIRAAALWHARKGGASGSYGTADLDDAIRRFEELARSLSGRTEGGLALAWQVGLTWTKQGGRLTPEVERLWKTLSGDYAGDDEVEAFLARQMPGLILQVRGLDDFEVTDLEGHRWNAGTMRGKIVLIDFWTTWCGPCLSDLPYLRTAYRRYHAEGFEVLGVSLDTLDRHELTSWLERNAIPWPQVYDGRGFESDLAKRFGVPSHGVPLTVLLDPHGEVVAADLRGPEILARLEALLASPGITRPGS